MVGNIADHHHELDEPAEEVAACITPSGAVRQCVGGARRFSASNQFRMTRSSVLLTVARQARRQGCRTSAWAAYERLGRRDAPEGLGLPAVHGEVPQFIGLTLPNAIDLPPAVTRPMRDAIPA